MIMHNSLKLKRTVALTVVFIMLFSILSLTYAQGATNNTDLNKEVNAVYWEDKINANLKTVMEETSDDELISVWLWLRDIDKTKITKALLEEENLDCEVYESQNRFYEEIAPKIAQQVENQVGYEQAHKVINSNEEMSTSEKEIFKEVYDKAEIQEEIT